MNQFLYGIFIASLTFILRDFVWLASLTFVLRDFVWHWLKKPVIPMECFVAMHELKDMLLVQLDKCGCSDLTAGFRKDDSNEWVSFTACDETTDVDPYLSEWFLQIEDLEVFRRNLSNNLVFKYDWKDKFRLSVKDCLKFQFVKMYLFIKNINHTHADAVNYFKNRDRKIIQQFIETMKNQQANS